MVRLLPLLLATTLVGCRAPTAQANEAPPPSRPSARLNTLGAGDIIEVRVFGEADLSNVYRLGPDGTIDFPFCRRLNLADTTTTEAAERLVGCLQPRYLKNPQITVFQREYNSKKVYVFGDVSKPGTFPYDPNLNLIQAITLAGGFNKTASRNEVNITRFVDSQEHRFKVATDEVVVGRAPNVLLEPGDIVYVPESFF